MKVIKFLIVISYLFLSFLVIALIFKRNFIHSDMQFSIDSWNEDMLLVILHSGWQSILAIFCLGLCAMFTNFVFIKIIFSSEIKEAAVLLIKHRKTQIKEQQEWIKDQSLKNKTWSQKLLYNIKNML